MLICVALFFINIADTKNLLALGDAKDKEEKRLKQQANDNQ